MKRVVAIIMERDGISAREALRQVIETRDAIQDALDAGEPDEVESIMADYLGLEPDYIMELI